MSENDNNQLVLFNSSDGMISLPVAVKNDSVWLTLDQISELFDRDKSTVSRHIHNVYRENELDTSSTVAKIATVQLEGTRKIERTLEYYNLDVIISVGYRVKSKRVEEFRMWANSVLNPTFCCQEMFRHACAFAECADMAQNKFKHESADIEWYTVPSIVNSAFACEVYLKALNKYYGSQIEKNHKLNELFDALPEEQKTTIQAEVMNNYGGIWKNALGLNLLDCISDAFVTWRYNYETVIEHGGCISIDTGFLNAFRDVLRDVCCRLFFGKTWDQFKQ